MTAKRDAGRSITAAILIGLGILFLLAQIFSFSFFGALWPLIVVLPGLPFLYAAFTGQRNTAGLIIPGAMITGTGAILFYQNITGHWESWAYVWSLYIVLMGLSLQFIGNRTQNEQTARTGQGFLKAGLATFVALWALFELLIFGGNTLLGGYLVPAIMIGAGAWMLLRRQSGSAERPGITLTDDSQGKPKRRLSPSEELQIRIEEALAEPENPDDSQIDQAMAPNNR